MKIILENGDRQYFESQIGQEIPDELWSKFEDWIGSNMYGTLNDQVCEELEKCLD